MIATDLENIEHQVPMTPLFKKAVDFLRRNNISRLPEGRVEIDKNMVFALVQRYETIPTETPLFEAHRKYIDIQFIVTGTEIIGWAPIERLTITETYDANKDACFGKVAERQWASLSLKEGQLAVFWPEDGHAPRLAVKEPHRVMKIVVKVSV